MCNTEHCEALTYAYLLYRSASKLPVDDIDMATFALPRLGPKLVAAASEVTGGRGVVILRGLKPQNYSLEDNILIYAGIGSYFGDKRGVQGRGRNFLSMNYSSIHMQGHADLHFSPSARCRLGSCSRSPEAITICKPVSGKYLTAALTDMSFSLCYRRSTPIFAM